MKIRTLLIGGIAAAAIAQHASAETIVDIAATDDSFSTLVAALKAADLVDTLQGEGPFTVFAPTNEAFDALPEGTVESLLEPANKEKLQSILTYHVVPGAIMSSDISGMTMAETVEGSEIAIDPTGDGVMVGEATVTQADIEASNGVIHVIDSVLMPGS